jgi:hypothetical protein
MTDKLPDVWANRDFPVLREVTRPIDSGEDMHPRLGQLAEATGLTPAEVGLAITALDRRGL